MKEHCLFIFFLSSMSARITCKNFGNFNFPYFSGPRSVFHLRRKICRRKFREANALMCSSGEESCERNGRGCTSCSREDGSRENERNLAFWKSVGRNGPRFSFFFFRYCSFFYWFSRYVSCGSISTALKNLFMQEKKFSGANYFAVAKTGEYCCWWLQKRCI